MDDTTFEIMRPSELLQTLAHAGPVWSHTTEQLNVNLLVFNPQDVVQTHINHAVDVLGVVIEGQAELTIQGITQTIQSGDTFIIQRGTERGLKALSRFVYLSCHQRRSGLMPTFPEQ